MKKILAIMIVLCLISLASFLYFNQTNKLSTIKGSFIADGTQHVFIIGYEEGIAVYSDNKDPFILTLDGKGNYELNMGDNNESGTYSFNDEEIVFKTKDNFITEYCKIKNENELHCNKYASLYVKNK